MPRFGVNIEDILMCYLLIINRGQANLKVNAVVMALAELQWNFFLLSHNDLISYYHPSMWTVNTKVLISGQRAHWQRLQKQPIPI